MDLYRASKRLGRIEQLDRLAEPLGRLVKRVVPPRTAVKDLLSGTWMGHPLHPMLTDIPIGSFTSATVLDLIGGRSGQRAADRLVDLGLAASVVTAAAGAADWSDTLGEDNRVGVVHAGANVAGVTLYAASAVARRRGRRATATTLGLAGMSAMTFGGYLGGYLSYGRGIGVNTTSHHQPPTEWTSVLQSEQLADGASRAVEADGVTVLLHRAGARVCAIGNTCTHAGGPLDEGDIDAEGCTVTCPWHQSEFRLDTGDIVHGPATVPQPAYETRIVDGRIEVRVLS